ncbi:KH domain-containing, RNA-binding, signal transduction-associated protein 2-like isoform X2 [Musca domestica]|uniref:KH domain-containing, RNA-binding, signal transduction-associated protein 2-like isoform X2 n=1 Tax=Musca domestica TaxID=7370 RepID=A0ABM3V201_MUSDO|nr:KH domain-containing, RNA-binding, signal transduction-associated protein 2-like isoform X2 [Musca domestica]
MANTYEGNGDYSTGPHNGDNHGGGGGVASVNEQHHGVSSSMGPIDTNYLNEKANEYVRDCLNEKSRMDRKFPIAEKLLDAEIEKVQTTGRLPSKEQKYADIYREKPLRVSQKVLVPIREHPKFNFVGKLLGPKGNSLRRLQEETMCKMTVLGRNSMRDRVKEEELRKSKDPKYSHLNSDLHVEISTVAPPAEAYARIAYAMAELRKYLIPDSNDVIRQEQLRELMDSTHITEEQKSTGYKKIVPHTPSAGGGGGGGILTGPGSVITSNLTKNMVPYNKSGGGGGGGGGQGGPNSVASAASAYNKNNTAPKQKVMSILEKARSAMEETYGRGYEDNQGFDHLQPSYDAPYSSYPQQAQSAHNHNPHVPQTPGMAMNHLNTGRGPYDTTSTDYETNDYSRRGGGGGGGAGDYYQNPTTAYGAAGIQPNNGGLNPNQTQNRSHVNR